jgi:hypothetical protein
LYLLILLLPSAVDAAAASCQSLSPGGLTAVASAAAAARADFIMWKPNLPRLPLLLLLITCHDHADSAQAERPGHSIHDTSLKQVLL